eukprot:gene4393-8742_t
MLHILLSVTCFILLQCSVLCYELPRCSKVASPKQHIMDSFQKSAIRTLFIGSLTFGTMSSQRANAAKGAIKVSTLEEAKFAVQDIKKCLDGMSEMKTAAEKKEYQIIADMLSKPPYTNFEEAASIVVRSDAITPDDKIALGTIKRYGVVADALIMLGGLSAELRSGGFKVGIEKKNDISSDDDEDSNDESDKDEVAINDFEVRKNIKLAKDSLADIYRIVAPVMNK